MLRTREEAIKYCGNIGRWTQKNINEFAFWLGLKPYGNNKYVVVHPYKKSRTTGKLEEGTKDWQIIYEASCVGKEPGLMSVMILFTNLVEVMEYLILKYTRS